MTLNTNKKREEEVRVSLDYRTSEKKLNAIAKELKKYIPGDLSQVDKEVSFEQTEELHIEPKFPTAVEDIAYAKGKDLISSDGFRIIEKKIQEAYEWGKRESRQQTLQEVLDCLPKEKDESISPNQHDFRKYREAKGWNQALSEARESIEKELEK